MRTSVANVKVSSASAINSWRVTVGLPPGVMTGQWNATLSATSGTVDGSPTPITLACAPA